MSAKRDKTDWLLFAVLSTLWASAYALTREAVETLPPFLVVPGRLWVGAPLLLLIAFVRKDVWPPFSDHRSWLTMAAMGLVGTTLPFFLITTAQQSVDSALAALFVCAAPIFVAASSHFLFHEERMTGLQALGVGVGFIGVVVLIGPDAFSSLESASALAQLILLVATISYASATLIARAAPKMSPFVFSAGFLSFGAVFSLPMLALIDWADVTPTTSSILSVIGLGIGPSAIASVIYPIVVNRAGPTFLSLSGYVIPVIAALIGWILFREVLAWYAYIAFVLILGGVFITQRGKRAASEQK